MWNKYQICSVWCKQMSVRITEEERWQGMLCVAWPRRVPWPPNSHLAAAQGQEGLDEGWGTAMLWDTVCFVWLCQAHSALGMTQGSHPLLGSSSHNWGNACLEQLSGTPRCLPWKGDVLTWKIYLGTLYCSKPWVFWWHLLQRNRWSICMQLQQHPFGATHRQHTATHRHYVTDLSQGFAGWRKLILQAGFGNFGALKSLMSVFFNSLNWKWTLRILSPIWGQLGAGCWRPSPVWSHVLPRMESHWPSG